MCFLVCDKEVMVRIIMSLSLFKSKKLLPTWKTLTGWRVETHTKTFLKREKILVIIHNIHIIQRPVCLVIHNIYIKYTPIIYSYILLIYCTLIKRSAQKKIPDKSIYLCVMYLTGLTNLYIQNTIMTHHTPAR